ncbi:hypothetical protein [Candidatus Brachybacter algidus]|uniref:hypothetical protein n=1 Tax=Candidatus Brachybacter algidus TaxID=2982024 RepID=UPI00257BA307|nr:hypothetical protein [Candidatus Brachybacter algidus]
MPNSIIVNESHPACQHPRLFTRASISMRGSTTFVSGLKHYFRKYAPTTASNITKNYAATSPPVGGVPKAGWRFLQ